MGFFDTVFELIDMRSFSSLWYWLALAGVWSGATRRVLGVPADLLHRARRSDAARAELETLARIDASRRRELARAGGATLLGLASAGFTALALLGFLYGMELAQAVFLLAAPLAAVELLALRTARVVADGLEGEALRRRLLRQRHLVQALGMLTIFVTALWGMYQNLIRGALLG